jgi:AbrB family looped-hinge helix DNA binding protein
MKATGIVRRIDDLGRVVIPKEIRRTLGIREADPLHTSSGEILQSHHGGQVKFLPCRHRRTSRKNV